MKTFAWKFIENSRHNISKFKQTVVHNVDFGSTYNSTKNNNPGSDL